MLVMNLNTALVAIGAKIMIIEIVLLDWNQIAYIIGKKFTDPSNFNYPSNFMYSLKFSIL